MAHCLDLSSPNTFPGRSRQLHSSVWAELNTGQEHQMGQLAFLKSFLRVAVSGQAQRPEACSLGALDTKRPSRSP